MSAGDAPPGIARLTSDIVAAVAPAHLRLQQIADTAWSESGCRVDTPVTGATAAERAEECREFHSQCIANTAWAYAKLGLLDAPLLAALSAQAVIKITD